MYTIEKKFRFEAAHRLIAPYQGKCNSVHGHSFRITVSMSAPILDESDMVIDFSALKPVGDWIKAHLDHATIVADRDSELREWLSTNQQKQFVVAGNPTSERLAQVVYARAAAMGFKLDRVQVSETCTACASFTEL